MIYFVNNSLCVIQIFILLLHQCEFNIQFVFKSAIIVVTNANAFVKNLLSESINPLHLALYRILFIVMSAEQQQHLCTGSYSRLHFLLINIVVNGKDKDVRGNIFAIVGCHEKSHSVLRPFLNVPTSTHLPCNMFLLKDGRGTVPRHL